MKKYPPVTGSFRAVSPLSWVVGTHHLYRNRRVGDAPPERGLKTAAALRHAVPEGYVVEIKPSARRVSGGVGEWVNRNGAHRAFETKALARDWARGRSPPDGSVWVQDAAPADDAPVDGYVVGCRRSRPRRHPEPGEQASLPP